MNDITPGNGRDWTLSYTKADGTPGLIDLTNSTTTITMVPDGFATVVVRTFDPATGQQVISVDHNGAVGDVQVTIENDGDLTPTGNNGISITETFSMMVAAGAVGVSGSVGAERPTPP